MTKSLNDTYNISHNAKWFEVPIDDEKFLLINLYNANIENNQLKVLDSLSSILDNHNTDGDCKIIFGGDFNLFLVRRLRRSPKGPLNPGRSLSLCLSLCLRPLVFLENGTLEFPNFLHVN